LESFLYLGGMVGVALSSMIVTAQPARRGRFGLPLSVVSVLGGVLAVLIYATGGTFGLDPLQAYAIALVGVLPALLGALAGFLLGWLRWTRRQGRAPCAGIAGAPGSG